MARQTRKKELNLNQKLTGSFGSFSTNKSNKLDYIMCTINIKDINILSTQSDVFDFDKVNFNEIVQRDVNIDRIDNEIIKNYLEDSSDETVFFPPILVSPILIDEDDSPKNQFENVIENDSEEMKKSTEYIKTWDDAMQLNLMYTEDSKELHTYTRLDGESIRIVNYATEFLYDDKKLKLVVIDGQHRFLALKRIFENKIAKDLIKDIDIPICLFFMPNAVTTQSQNEAMNLGMRKLFVTINSEAKKVSGHFIELLKDDSISSIIVRRLADRWKDESNHDSMLHYLEWNQHQDKKANTVTKPYSITTVSILAEGLRRAIFNNKVYTNLFLKLSNVEQDLNTENGVSYKEIKDSNFAVSQLEVLTKQVDNCILPSLDILFLTPEIYKSSITKFQNALEWIDDCINNKDDKLANYYKQKILFDFRFASHNDFEFETMEAIEEKFYEFLFLDFDNEEFYYRNVFQHAYLEAWSDFYYEISSYIPEIKLEDFTNSFVKALQNICFNVNEAYGYFASSNDYTQNIIYKNKRILVSETSRTQIKNLIISTFLNEKQLNMFISDINRNYEIDKESLYKEIYMYSEKLLTNYMITFKQTTISKLRKEWQYYDLPEDTKQSLERLYKNLKKSTENLKEINQIFNKILDEKVDKAKKLLTNNLDISEDIIELD